MDITSRRRALSASGIRPSYVGSSAPRINSPSINMGAAAILQPPSVTPSIGASNFKTPPIVQIAVSNQNSGRYRAPPKLMGSNPVFPVQVEASGGDGRRASSSSTMSAAANQVSNQIRPVLGQNLNGLASGEERATAATLSCDLEKGEEGASTTQRSCATISHQPEISIESEGRVNGSKNGVVVDLRNESYDEDFANEDIGLSTVPNRYCTVRDAIELRKLLQLSKGSRGGIVPSSSAVMDVYMVGNVIGVGSYGKVRAAWHRLTGRKVAIKTYDKARLKDQSHWKRVHSEIKVTELVSHPRIARMFEAVETPKRLHLIMEFVEGGNLCSHVKQKKKLSEGEVKKIFYQLMLAIEYLHLENVAHRFLSPSFNFLFIYKLICLGI